MVHYPVVASIVLALDMAIQRRHQAVVETRYTASLPPPERVTA
ncbi:MAG: hypothetical protein U0768_11185 [Anaerolineae bacterium]